MCAEFASFDRAPMYRVNPSAYGLHIIDEKQIAIDRVQKTFKVYRISPIAWHIRGFFKIV